MLLNSCSGSITFSPTVIELHNAPAWKVTPNSRRSAASVAGSLSYRSRLPYNTRPLAGCCRPTR